MLLKNRYQRVPEPYQESDASGEVEKSRELDMNEVRFLEFGNEAGTFTPRYHGHLDHDGRTLLFMERFDMSLEDKLVELAKRRELVETPFDRERIDQEAFEYVQKAIDVVLINNYLANAAYKTKDPFKGVTISEQDADEYARYMNIFLYNCRIIYYN